MLPHPVLPPLNPLVPVDAYMRHTQRCARLWLHVPQARQSCKSVAQRLGGGDAYRRSRHCRVITYRGLRIALINAFLNS